MGLSTILTRTTMSSKSCGEHIYRQKDYSLGKSHMI